MTSADVLSKGARVQALYDKLKTDPYNHDMHQELDALGPFYDVRIHVRNLECIRIGIFTSQEWAIDFYTAVRDALIERGVWNARFGNHSETHVSLRGLHWTGGFDNCDVTRAVDAIIHRLK